MKSTERGQILQEDDKSSVVVWGDVPAALGLLTRLPIKVDAEAAMARGAASAWAYPVVGLCLAALTLVVVTVLSWLGVSTFVLAGVCLLVPIVLTGAMHEDGLADSADGLWGGWTKERRLEIMKDSRIGTYGVLALILSLLLRFAALSALIEADVLAAALLISAAGSRANMVVLMSLLPNARDNGLSQSVGRPSHQTMLVGCGVAIVAGALLSLWALPAVLIVAILVALLCAAIAKAKIGGQTGDTLGATQQVSEIALLITFSALLT